MASIKIVCLAVCLAVAVSMSSAAPGHAESYLVSNLHSHGGYSGYGGLGGVYGGHHEEYYADTHPKYAYKYGVADHHTGDHKEASEHRDGDSVQGEYSLLQPDGRKRTVHYTSNHHDGFNAHVTYSGHAVHPQQYGHHHGSHY